MLSPKVQDYINFKPYYIKIINGVETTVYYETSFYCKTNFIIHANLKTAINCPNCFTNEDRESLKRIE